MRIFDIKDLELRKLALSRVDPDYYDYIYYIETDDLVHAFEWSKTPEGEEFWDGVNEEIITKVPNKDSVVEEVISKFKGRSETGIKKYGTTLDRDDLSLDDWLNHAVEEGMDMILYLTKIRKEIGERRSIQDRKD